MLVIATILAASPAMALLLQGQVGPQTAQDGSNPNLRQSKDASLVNVESHGRYQEATYRGNVYTIQTAAAGITLAATNLAPLNSSTGKPIVGVFNPQNSVKDLVILETCIGISSNTTPGNSPGAFYYDVNTNQALTQAGTVPINNLTLVQRGSAAVGLVNQALTGGTGTVLDFKAVSGAPQNPYNQSNATNATGSAYTPIICDPVDGKIIVPPGGVLGIANGISNTTAIVFGSMTWEEIPQ